MNIWNSATYRGDIADVAAIMDLDILRQKSILITGATGLICSAVIDMLIFCNMTQNMEITIYAVGRNKKKLENRFSHGLDFGVKPIEYDATQPIHFDFSADYILHGASNATPEKYISEPVDTMLANIQGIHNLLEYARKNNVIKTVYISSSEVYGILAHGKPLCENEYGSVDILSDRASYPMGKRAAETLCISYANQYGLNVSIVRPGHIYGPTAQSSDKRISSVFAREAAIGNNLVMKSEGTQIRSYCHCLDCASAILTVLTRGESKEAYNISNSNSVITIHEMAKIISKVSGVSLLMDIPTGKEKTAFNPMNNSSLNSTKLEKLGWRGKLDAVDGFQKTVVALRETQLRD